MLVAFDAGARTERPEENGMAHFLEHLVFKGGQKYDDYRKVNQTAETMGAVLNAYTSHDLVAFHITCRAEVAAEAIDLLTDFVGRPKIDAEELDRERGVVIQEIARAQDQPSVLAEHLIDRAAFGDHPLGPARCSARGAPADVLARRDPRRSGAASGSASRGGAFLVGNLDHLPEDSEMAELFGRFPSISVQRRLRAGAAVRARRRWSRTRESAQSHLRMSYRPKIDPRAPAERAALGVYSTLLGGSMGSRLFDEIREQRGLAYSVYALDHSFADVPILQLSRRPGLRRSASRPTRACARSSRSCAPTARPRKRSSAPAPTPPAGACWRSRTPTPSPATPRRRPSSSTRTSTPTRRSKRSTR